MTSGIRLRRAQTHEAEEVARILITGRAASYPAVPAAVHSDEETVDWVRDRLMVEAQVWVADLDGVGLLGVMALADGQLEQLYLLPGWTGRGIGSEFVRRAQEISPEGLELWTFVSNQRARRFYERHGFVAVEETDGSGNEEQSPDVRMRWTP